MDNLPAVRVADRVGDLPQYVEPMVHGKFGTMHLHELVEAQ